MAVVAAAGIDPTEVRPEPDADQIVNRQIPGSQNAAHVPAAHGGVVLGIVLLATVAAAALVAGERPSLGFWVASATGAAVVIAFVLRDHNGVGFAVGDMFLLGTVVCGAFGYALSGRLSMQMPGWEVISWQVAGFLPFSLIAALAMWHWQTLDHVPASAWAGLAYVSFVSQFFAFFVFNAAMALAGVARAGQERSDQRSG